MRSARTGRSWRAGTFRFRDPLNKERRFLPLRLDDAPIKGSLAQFLYINWLPADREQEYAKLLEACRPPRSSRRRNHRPRSEQIAEKAIQLDHEAKDIWAWRSVRTESVPSPARQDKTVRLWDVETGRCLRVLEGHTGGYWSVAWSADQRRALSGSRGQYRAAVGRRDGRCLRVLEGHTSRL